MKSPLEGFQEIVGAEFVNTDPAVLKAVTTTTYRTSQSILGIVQPGSKEEIQECMVLSQSHQIPIYPISTGKNWGYGGRVPVTNGCVLLDLSRLNRIRDYDETLGCVTVETGVTFADLHRFLRREQSRLLLSVTSSSPETSIIANTLERGIGSGPYADRVSSSCGMEVVLPTGELIQTGFARFPNARTSMVHRNGVGPALDGLFFQSNLGVVTSMTFWLVRRPAWLGILFGTLDHDSKLPGLIDAFRESILDQIVRPPMAIFDRHRVQSILDTLPSFPGTPRAQPQASAWSFDLAIHENDSSRLDSIAGQLRQRLEPHCETLNTFITPSDEMDQRLQGHRSTAPSSSQEHPFRTLLIDKHLGIPKAEAVRQVYWKMRSGVPENSQDPDRDGCGLIWCSPVVPLVGSEIRSALDTIARAGTDHGLMIPTSIQCTTERSATIIASIVFDRNSPGEDERALNCHDQMCESLQQAGFYPYRYSTHSLAKTRADSVYNRLLTTLKSALDKNRMLAPARYL